MAAKKRGTSGGKHPTQRPRAAGEKAAAGEAKARRAAKAEAAAAAARHRRRRRAARRVGASVVVAVLVLVVGALVWRNAQAKTNARRAMTATGCRYDSRSDPGAGDTGNRTFEVDPPSGGPHGVTPAAARFYQPGDAPDDGAVVHALEHGRIAIWYRPDLPAPEIERLTDLLELRDGMVLLVPRMSLSGPVAATAWRRRLLCPRPDVDSLGRFVRAYANKGPEKQPVGSGLGARNSANP